MHPLTLVLVILASAAIASGPLLLMRSAVAPPRPLRFIVGLAILAVVVGVAFVAPVEYSRPIMSGLGAAVIVHFLLVTLRLRRTPADPPSR